MRRMFAFATVLLACLLGGAAALAEFDEGIEYQRISPALPNLTDGKVEVVELFWYGCPSCFQVEPRVEAWLANKPADVTFVRLPAIFSNPRWEVHARAYYTAEVLGVLERIHRPLFDAIHLQRRPLADEASLQQFFAEHGVSGGDFAKAFRSFSVDSKVRRAKDLSARYGITGVPSMVVNGKYRTDGTMAGGHETMMRVVDHLVARERAAPAAAR